MSRLLQTAAAQPGVDGIMTVSALRNLPLRVISGSISTDDLWLQYTMKAALDPCTSPPLYGADDAPPGGGLKLDHQLGCIVRRAYGAMSRANVSELL